MRYVKSLFVAVSLVLVASSHASAGSISFLLNCQFTGPTNDGSCSPSGTFGTVTLSDGAANPFFIDFTVTLNPGWYATGLYLNVQSGIGTTAPFTTWTSIAGINSAPTFSLDNSGSAGYLYMDLAMDATKPNTNPWSGTFALSNGAKPPTYADLNPSMFAVITGDPEAGPLGSNTALVYLAVNQINCTGTGCGTGATQQFIGSTQVIPEPASLLLFGSGLSGLGVFARSRGRNSKRG